MLVAKGTRDEGYLWAEKRKERQMRETIRDFGNRKDDPEDREDNLAQLAPPVKKNDCVKQRELVALNKTTMNKKYHNRFITNNFKYNRSITMHYE